MAVDKSYRFDHSVTKLRLFALLILALAVQPTAAQDGAVQDSFVELRDLIPDLHIELRYFGENNFVGSRVDGYRAEKLYITREAATALVAVQAELAPFGLGLKVFDAYRPQPAVDHFVRWAEDLNDTKMKQQFYPEVAKDILFDEGYISARSGHSRGSSIDLTLVDADSGEELDMGTPWDFFDPASWPSYQDLSAQARANRNLLAAVMTKHGFNAIRTEWWHFNLANEPFPDTYFSFPIE